MKKLLILVMFALFALLCAACMPSTDTGGPGYTLTGRIGVNSLAVHVDPAVPISPVQTAAQRTSAVQRVPFGVDVRAFTYPRTGEVVVRLGPCGNPDAVACTTGAQTGGVLVGGVITVQQPNHPMVHCALMHEFGHVLGLGHWDGVYAGHTQLMNHALAWNVCDWQAGDRAGLRAEGL